MRRTAHPTILFPKVNVRLLLALFLRALIVNYLHMLIRDKLNSVFLSPGDTALENERKEYSRHSENGGECLVGEADLVIGAVCRIADRGKRCLSHLKKLGSHSRFSVEPEVLGIAVSVINGKRREILGPHTVYDSIAVFFLHKYFIDLKNKMRSEFRGYTVKIVIGTFISVQLPRNILIRTVKLSYPGAFNSLDGIAEYHRSFFSGLLLKKACLKLETALRHLFLRLVSRPGKLNGFLEARGLVVDEIQCAFSVAQDILSGIGGITAAQKHCVIILSRYVIRLNQGVRAEICASILTESGNNNRWHREEEGRLIKIINDAKIFKAAHFRLLLYVLFYEFLYFR